MPLNSSDYAVLKALYKSTGGQNWRQKLGWEDWDFTRAEAPDLAIAQTWQGVAITGDRVTSLDLRNWHLVGAGQFDGGRQSDLIWHHQGTGALKVWPMQNGQPSSSSILIEAETLGTVATWTLVA